MSTEDTAIDVHNPCKRQRAGALETRRLPFLSPAFPGQSAALVVTTPDNADDKVVNADVTQYSLALTTPDSKKCPLPQDWPSTANSQAWLGFGLAPQAWLAAASPQTRPTSSHRAHARATARLELMRSALPLDPNPYPIVRGGPCPGDDLRDEVSQFIVQLCDEFELAQWTCYLAISYMDHTLSTLHVQGLADAQLAKHARNPVLLTVCVRLAAKFADTKLPDPEDMILPRDLRCEQSDRPLDSETLMECYSMVKRQCRSPMEYNSPGSPAPPSRRGRSEVLAGGWVKKRKYAKIAFEDIVVFDTLAGRKFPPRLGGGRRAGFLCFVWVATIVLRVGRVRGRGL